jgi:hypothetical protein
MKRWMAGILTAGVVAVSGGIAQASTKAGQSERPEVVINQVGQLAPTTAVTNQMVAQRGYYRGYSRPYNRGYRGNYYPRGGYNYYPGYRSSRYYYYNTLPRGPIYRPWFDYPGYGGYGWGPGYARGGIWIDF